MNKEWMKLWIVGENEYSYFFTAYKSPLQLITLVESFTVGLFANPFMGDLMRLDDALYHAYITWEQ